MKRRVLATLGGILLLFGRPERARARPGTRCPQPGNRAFENATGRSAGANRSASPYAGGGKEGARSASQPQAAQPGPGSQHHAGAFRRATRRPRCIRAWRRVEPASSRPTEPAIAAANPLGNGDYHAGGFMDFTERLPFRGWGQRHRHQLRQHPIQQRPPAWEN